MRRARSFAPVVALTLALVGSSQPTPTPVQVDRQPSSQSSSPAAFDGSRAWQHLERIVAIGSRPAGSAELRQTRAYITRQISAMGLSVEEQPFVANTPVGRVEMSNLIVRLPGRRPDRVLIAGHYDTKLMPGKRFVGASDGGSSSAWLIELARVLADTPREFSYEIIWLDGEEAFCTGWTDCGTSDAPDNTYGSRYYVEAARRAGALSTIRALVLVDMIADRDLQFRRDTNSTAWLVDIVWDTARRLGHGDVFVDAPTTIEDDHVPFLRAGVPAIDIIDLDYPQWHTPDDTLEHVSPRGLQIVGDVVMASLPAIEEHLKRER